MDHPPQHTQAQDDHAGHLAVFDLALVGPAGKPVMPALAARVALGLGLDRLLGWMLGLLLGLSISALIAVLIVIQSLAGMVTGGQPTAATTAGGTTSPGMTVVAVPSLAPRSSGGPGCRAAWARTSSGRRSPGWARLMCLAAARGPALTAAAWYRTCSARWASADCPSPPRAVRASGYSVRSCRVVVVQRHGRMPSPSKPAGIGSCPGCCG